MALTPAQQYRQKLLAQQAQKNAKTGPHGAVRGSEYEQLLARLAEHKRSLKTIASSEGKGQYKAQAVLDFDGWVDGVLASGTGAADEVFTTMLAWHFDAGNYLRCLELAAYAIKHKLIMPDQFKRSVPMFIVDEYAKAALAGKFKAPWKADQLLERVITLTDGEDVHDEPRARLYKAYTFARIGRLESADINKDLAPEVAAAALAGLRRALELDDNVGVKKEINKLESYLKKTAPELLNPVQPAPQAAQAEGDGAAAQADAQPPADA